MCIIILEGDNMKKIDLIEYSIFLLSFLTLLLYFLANICQYIYNSHIPSSITFFRYGFNIGSFIDYYLNLYHPNEAIISGWHMCEIDMSVILYGTPVILLPIQTLYGSFTQNNNYYHIRNKSRVTNFISSFMVLALLFYYFNDASHFNPPPGLGPLEYPIPAYVMLISMIIVLILNRKRVKLDKHQYDTTVESNQICISFKNLTLYMICLYLFISFFFCTVTNAIKFTQVSNFDPFDLYFPLFFATHKLINKNNLPGINGTFIPSIFLGLFPVILFILFFFKKFQNKLCSIIKIILSSSGIIYTILTMVWFLNHFMVIGATSKKNPNIFDVAGINFYLTIFLYIAILVVSIMELKEYLSEEKTKVKNEIPFDDCIIKEDEVIA